MQINIKQVVCIVLVVLGVLTASTAQLTDLFGPGITKAIVSIAGLLNSILSGVLAVITSQTSTIKDVVAMAKDPSSPVQGVVTTSTQEGKDLAKSIEGPIVSAGTSAATEIAKS